VCNIRKEDLTKNWVCYPTTISSNTRLPQQHMDAASAALVQQLSGRRSSRAKKPVKYTYDVDIGVDAEEMKHHEEKKSSRRKKAKDDDVFEVDMSVEEDENEFIMDSTPYQTIMIFFFSSLINVETNWMMKLTLCLLPPLLKRNQIKSQRRQKKRRNQVKRAQRRRKPQQKRYVYIYIYICDRR
jgi:hypothetical protein